MGVFGGDRIITDGEGGFGVINNNGVTSAPSSADRDPVDSLIDLAGQLADQDGE